MKNIAATCDSGSLKMRTRTYMRINVLDALQQRLQPAHLKIKIIYNTLHTTCGAAHMEGTFSIVLVST